MNKNNLLKLTLENSVSYLAIIGLAKNAGKTVTLNTIIREAEKADIKLAVASYGRDGEDIDIITLKEKPRIFIPPYTYFVTTEKLFEKSGLPAQVEKDTELDTLLGRVKIYKSGSCGASVELAGVNRGSGMAMIKSLMPADVDLFLIDGALDRRSSAIPSLTQGVILATGAVVGNSVDLIVQRTLDEIERITLPSCIDREDNSLIARILNTEKSGLIRSNKIIPFDNYIFGPAMEFDFSSAQSGDVFVLSGALTDSFAESLLLNFDGTDCSIIIRDGTRVFLNRRNMNLLKKKNITLMVQNAIKLIAVTVNPYSPYGFRVDSNLLAETLWDSLTASGLQIPVFDVLSEEYI